MRRIFNIIILLIFIATCKTIPKNNNAIENVTNFKINKNNIDKDKLREHIKALFTLIEKKIVKGDYKAWYNLISRKYKYFLNDPANLKKIAAESDYLFNRRINLTNPKDYFKYVVIQSREGKSLKFVDYEYVNQYHIKVICLFDNKDEFVYRFIYEENLWKLDR
ncbi:MAG: hypothetical protein KAT05_17285 [Spirochaetes bacterium]|nr:hypothetical protein [Spirochaetota bacterium]